MQYDDIKETSVVKNSLMVQCDYCGDLCEKHNCAVKNSKETGAKLFCSRKCYTDSKKNGILIKCNFCEKECYKTPSDINHSLSDKLYCSKLCANKDRSVENQVATCTHCNKLFERSNSDMNYSKKNNSNLFCSKNCHYQYSKKPPVETKCHTCNKLIYRPQHEINRTKKLYCSEECRPNNMGKMIPCTLCGKEVYKTPCQIKNAKNIFCGKSCNTKYRNMYGKNNYKRSKLEKFIEEDLTLRYSNLEILFNNREQLNCGLELDIYIPSLKFAIEINGIVHYRPIYGEDRLAKVQDADFRKSKICEELGIKLLIIDCTTHNNITLENSQDFIHIIVKAIEESLNE